MSRKLYLHLVAAALSLLFLYTLAGILFLKDLGIRPYNTANIRMGLAVLILFTETSISHNWLRRLGFILLPVFVLGYLFTIMHWPFGGVMLLGSLLTVIVTVAIDAIRSPGLRIERLVLLVYPVCHFLFAFSRMLHLNPRATWWVDFLAQGVAAVALWLVLLWTSRKW